MRDTGSIVRTRSTCFRTRRMSRRLFRFCASVQESFEQRSELARSEEVLRMPLDADAEAGVRILDAFDDAVGRGRGDDEACRELPDRLVVPAVDVAGIGIAQPLAHHA